MSGPYIIPQRRNNKEIKRHIQSYDDNICLIPQWYKKQYENSRYLGKHQGNSKVYYHNKKKDVYSCKKIPLYRKYTKGYKYNTFFNNNNDEIEGIEMVDSLINASWLDSCQRNKYDNEHTKDDIVCEFKKLGSIIAHYGSTRVFPFSSSNTELFNSVAKSIRKTCTYYNNMRYLAIIVFLLIKNSSMKLTVDDMTPYLNSIFNYLYRKITIILKYQGNSVQSCIVICNINHVINNIIYDYYYNTFPNEMLIENQI
uniref:Uncharacterized protein n=1 Tax=Trachysalambria curvirostris majanivirus TaxID=2984281 RepID=A0A9C7C6Q9_9VIRU|nr:MAG: hypothetical protein [Trachysalambria curvirostris majanivirus]